VPLYVPKRSPASSKLTSVSFSFCELFASAAPSAVGARQRRLAERTTAQASTLERAADAAPELVRILNLEDFGRACAELPGERRIVDQRHAIGRDHLLQLRQPAARRQ
jgi:hypothetical protein